MRLTHVRLLVSDYDACFRFYRDVMGFEVAWGAEGKGYADFRVGAEGMALALFDRAAMSQAIGREAAPLGEEPEDRLSLICQVDDLDAEIERLQAKGVQFVAEATDHPDWGIRTAHFRDPEGNLIEINTPMPHGEWSEELKEEAERNE